jgi:quercetin dioxygenase-like cupin family protein
MIHRTALLLCVFLAGIGVGHAVGQGSSAQRAPRMWADRILDVATEEIPRRARVWTSSDHWDPGAETGRHAHPGPTVFVLLEGELEETLADGQTRTLKAVQGYWKPARTEHNVRNRGDKPARALAVHLDPR